MVSGPEVVNRSLMNVFHFETNRRRVGLDGLRPALRIVQCFPSIFSTTNLEELSAKLFEENRRLQRHFDLKFSYFIGSKSCKDPVKTAFLYRKLVRKN